MSLHLGYGNADITPTEPLPLSGFVARCDRPMTGVHDPLSVAALHLKHAGSEVLLLVFDLLGLDTSAEERLHTALDNAGIPLPERRRRIFCCTHTHSAPAVFPLRGCGRVHQAYVGQVADSAVRAARGAMVASFPVSMRTSHIRLPGSNYNRRSILRDGRVVMALHPGDDEAERGPTLDTLRLLRFDGANGEPIVGLAHWAAHACTVCSPEVSADFPGALRAKLSDKLGFPFIYLQGACGNLNPPFVEMSFAEMEANVGKIMARVGDPAWKECACMPLVSERAAVRLGYETPAAMDSPSCNLPALEALARTGTGNESVVSEIENILNVEPGSHAPDALLRHTAGTLAGWVREVLPRYTVAASEGKKLGLCALRLGDRVLLFIAAEVFAETALALQTQFPDREMLTVGVASPLIGYMPTDRALEQGGYEVDYAYRFYGEPAAYRRGSEDAVLNAARRLVGKVLAPEKTRAGGT